MSSFPLAGVRVLDLGSPIAAWCGRLLADLGADTVLVEPPDGDPYRRLGPFRDGPRGGQPESLSFAYFHANKRGIVVDPDVEADRELLVRLGGWADVVLIAPTPENPVPGLDPGAGSLEWAGPDTIVCSVTPFGLSGPYRDRPVTYLTSYAQASQMARVGAPGTPPKPIPAHLHWHLAGAHAAVSVLATLAARPVVGPQFIDISALEVEAYHDLQLESYDGRGFSPGGRTVGIGIPPSGIWECSDGPVAVAAHADRHWSAFLEMLDHPDELSEPGLADMAVRRQIHDGVRALIAPLMATRSTEELVERGQGAGLPICERNTPASFLDDPQLAERHFWTDVAVGRDRPVPAPGPPVRSQPALLGMTRPAPLLGEHDVEVRASLPGGGSHRAPVTVRAAPEVSGALEGLRVLSLGAFMAGNTTAQILGGLGADVVKVEARSRPESLRNAAYNEAPELAFEPSGVPITPMLASLSRGTRGLALEMGTAEGQSVFRDLVAHCDVVVENFGVGVMRSWGATFADLTAVNPRLVMASLSGFGRTGPRSRHLAYASNISDFTGLTHAWWSAGTLTDYVTATHAVIGILAGHRHASSTGEPVYVDAAQTEAFAAMGAELYLGPLSGLDAAVPEPPALLSHVTRCAGDDRWAAVEVVTEAQWTALCRTLGRDESGYDALSCQAIVDALDEWACPLTPATVARVLNRAGVPASAVATAEEVYADPNLHHRHFPATYDHPDLGRVTTPGSPHRLSLTPGHFPRLGPRVGEHTIEVLRQWACLDDESIGRLLAAGVVFDASAVG